ncbi:MAG: bifunctional riboflavin kinase/FAD synthetase [Gammaproteobacteria bacterium]|jgi:riboflavin kinase/FMN adenylyltransferase
MELIRGIHNLRPRHRGSVASIGNYDGMHLGHQQVLGQLVERARQYELPSVVMCFEPTPREFFTRDKAPMRLSSFREKFLRVAEQGVDRFFCVRFNARVAAMTPEEFIRDLLVDGIGVRHLVVGDDFRFGHERAGDFHTLLEAGARFGFAVDDTPSYSVDGQRVSSTAVRDALGDGDMARARRLLGRNYAMSGRVVHGERLGRQLGFPTANIRVGHRSSPLRGVFAVRVSGLGPVRAAMANLGTRPTVNGREMLLEVHIFDFSETIYGRRIGVEFIGRLRDEQRFASVEEMTEQLQRDARQARQLLAAPS